MDIKKIITEQLLIEARIAQISSNISLSMDVYETSHSKIRRFRDKDKNEIIITNSEIRNLVEKAKNDIAFNIVQGNISNGDNFVITDKIGEKKISLAIVLEEETPYYWKLILKTVFSELAYGEPFRVSRDQLHIIV